MSISEDNHSHVCAEIQSLPFAGGPEELALVRANPLSTLIEHVHKCGDIFTYRGDDEKTVVLNHPSYVRHVLVDHADRYSKIGTPELEMLRPILGDGLMTVEGKAWDAQRALATPHFLEGQLKNYFTFMEEEISDLLDLWQESSKGVMLEDSLSGLTLRIVARCLFETTLSVEESGDVGSGVRALNEYMATGEHADSAVYQERCQAMEKMTATVWSIVHCGLGQNKGERKSLLADLHEKMEKDKSGNITSIVDQVFTFLMAGHETTAKALIWTIYLLASRPELQKELQVEVDALGGCANINHDSVKQLSSVESTLFEAMRLYPPVWMISRRAKCDDVIGGYRVPKGALAVMSPYLLHRHTAFWKNPETFDSHRFCNGAAQAMANCSFFPFGAGRRTCIGRRFAMVEMVLFLAQFLSRFNIESIEPAFVRPQALVTLRPEAELRLWLKPR